MDGTTIRDYIHIMDLAEGHLKALNYLNQCTSKVLNLNLGTGKGTSVLELINAFQKVNKVEIPFEFASRRNGDYAISVADNSLAKNRILSSKSEARRAIANKGLKIDNIVIEDEKKILNKEDFSKNQLKLSFGKKKHYLIKII